MDNSLEGENEVGTIHAPFSSSLILPAQQAAVGARSRSQSASLVPETPDAEASQGEEEEDAEGELEEQDEPIVGAVIHGHDVVAHPAAMHELAEASMDMDNDLEEEDAVVPVSLEAPRIERVSSKSSTSKSTNNKRKHGQDSSRGSTPLPPTVYDDSMTVSAPPLLVPSPIPGFHSTRNHPINRPTFRYTPCGPSPLTSARLPLYRVIQCPPVNTVRFAWEDRSSYVHIAADAQSITTEKGFRSARANIPIREGSWYFEVIIEKGASDSESSSKGDGYGPHVRLGLARREAPLNAPAGFDAYSYGIRDKTGDKVYISQCKRYGEGFGTGDVIGVYVSLPSREAIGKRPITRDDAEFYTDYSNPARIHRRRVPIRYKGQLYWESMEFAPSKEMEDLAFKTKDPLGYKRTLIELEEKKKKSRLPPPPGKRKPPPIPVAPPPRSLPVLHGSKIAFFKNGEYQGVAFEDLLDWLPLRQHAKDIPRIGPDGLPMSGAAPRQSAASAIAATREHHHDDGSLGYFPFVSVFGGGIARLNAGPDFGYPPPLDIGQIIQPETAAPGASMSVSADSATWRPLHERYEEYYQEISAFDETEDRAQIHHFEKTGSLYLPHSSSYYFSPGTPNQGPTYAPGTPQTRSTSPASASGASPPSFFGTGSSPAIPYAKNMKKKTGLSNELVLDTPGNVLLDVAARESTPGQAGYAGDTTLRFVMPETDLSAVFAARTAPPMPGAGEAKSEAMSPSVSLQEPSTDGTTEAVVQDVRMEIDAQ